ncbi:MAG TPA: tRNA glutamyl-Q(34) synthetase GluQRS [Thermoanaerobaculia bacterium]
MTTGRFAPSPTGPLHLGSLVAAVGSWLFARYAGGRWLVRMEDLDTPRVVPGSADEILRALERYALTWDGEVVYQSQRIPLYEAALNELRSRNRLFDCACSRADLLRAASAPAGEEAIYTGTCRNGIAGGRAPRAVRFRGNDAVDDFVVKRADGVFAYQLAVVVDDAAQGVTQVVRGADLLSSMPRQIALQQALGHPTPEYIHLPLVLGPDGKKLGKRDGALPLPSLDDHRVTETLRDALRFLGVEVDIAPPAEMLRGAIKRLPSIHGSRGAAPYR